MRKIILASGSPRRKELLAQAGLIFEVCISDAKEEIIPASPEDTVKSLSYQKAQAVAERFTEDCIVIGADTLVAYEDNILGKPASEDEALAMLTMLQGHVHQVYTGVTLIYGDADHRQAKTFACRTDVKMYPASKAQLLDYISTGEPMDKAGAYGIQGRAAVFVEEIHGDYNNVVGLPVSALWQMLQTLEEDQHAAL